jgi:hypothetical protein
VALDLEGARDVVELLADVFPDALERTAAAAHGVLGLMMDLTARQMRRQRRAARLVLGRLFPLSSAAQRLELKADRLQILIDRLLKEAALRGIELLAAPAEAPTL